MKNILRRIRCGLLWGGLLACTGCNQEVFVDRIAPAETHFTLDGNGDTLVIDFPSEDWSVLDVTSESGKSLISFVSSDNGGPVTKMEDRERLEFSLGGLLDCAVVRDEGRRLVVMLGENLLQEDYRMDIHVGNDYVDIPLEFRLTLGEPYRVDSVVYRLEPDSPWTEVREGEGLVVYNQSADTIRQQLVISGKNRSWGRFSVVSDDNVSWLSGTELEIPDSVTKIGYRAFADCVNLMGVTVGSGAEYIGDDAFLGCRKLVEVRNRSSLTISAQGRENGGIGYYQVSRDASTEFFIDKMRKGSYVIEYTVYVDRAGIYQAGMADIQSAYAPEFAGHTGGMSVTVGD